MAIDKKDADAIKLIYKKIQDLSVKKDMQEKELLRIQERKKAFQSALVSVLGEDYEVKLSKIVSELNVALALSDKKVSNG